MNESVVRLWTADPQLRHVWDRYKRSSEYKDDEPYNALAELAHCLVQRHVEEISTNLEALFNELESALQEADAAGRNLLIVGFIEDLQNISMNRSVSMAEWERWLGPITREAWKQVEDLWSGRITPLQFNAYVDRS